MNNLPVNNKLRSALQLGFAAAILIAFFLPWAAWSDSKISGFHFPSGEFFRISASKFHLGNPYPGLSFSFNLFWLIPVLSVLVIGLVTLKRQSFWPALITGALSLSLVSVYFLFSRTLIDLGTGQNPFRMLQPAAYITVLAGVGLILTSRAGGNWLIRIVFLLGGPVFAWAGFMIIEKKVWGETHEDTTKVKADYTLSAEALIREFAADDTASNHKYREKMIVLDGNLAQVEIRSDSTVNIKFTDTSHYFINVSLDKNEFEHTRSLKPGDAVSIKGSCSGSSYSMILDSTSIDFKRSTLIKQ